jgi:hypothetical protein
MTNGFSKKIENHAAAVSLYVAHYNWCRVHESLTPNARQQNTPAMALGITDHVWSIGELLDPRACHIAAGAHSDRAPTTPAIPGNSGGK